MIRHVFAITVDASGNATTTSEQICVGEVFDVQYVASGTPFDTTVDFTITGAVTGKSIITLTNVAAAFTHHVRAAVVDTAGAARLYAAGGTAVADRIAVSEPIKIVTAQGGVSKTGTIYITVG